MTLHGSGAGQISYGTVILNCKWSTADQHFTIKFPDLDPDTGTIAWSGNDLITIKWVNGNVEEYQRR